MRVTNTLRNRFALVCGVVSCISCLQAWSAPPPSPLATVRNSQPGAAAAVGGQPPALVSNKPRFPIVPAGVPIKATPITRTTTTKAVPQALAQQGPIANNQANASQQAANAQTAPTAQATAKPVSKTPATAATPTSSQATTPAPASTVAAPGNVPPAPTAPATAPAAPASGNGAGNAGNGAGGNAGSGGNTSGATNAGANATPAPAAPSGN